MYLFTAACLGAAILGALAEHTWRHRRDARRRRLGQAAAEEQQRLLQTLAHQLEGERRRRRELEEVVVRLSGFLQRHPLEADERRLLNDLYHDFGTEGHGLHFGDLRSDVVGS